MRTTPVQPSAGGNSSDHLVWNVISSRGTRSYHDNPKADPHWEWAKEPEVREAVRPQVAELARVATFLASEGKALNATAYALFVDAVSDNLLPAITLLERRANGDYSRDDTPDSFPAVHRRADASTGISCWDLFESFCECHLSPQTTLCSVGEPCSLRCNGILRMSVPMGSPRMPRVHGCGA